MEDSSLYLDLLGPPEFVLSLGSKATQPVIGMNVSYLIKMLSMISMTELEYPNVYKGQMAEVKVHGPVKLGAAFD